MSLKRLSLVFIAIVLTVMMITPVLAAPGFVKDLTNPVLTKGAPATFDESWVAAGCVIDDAATGAVHRMWYTAKDADGFLYIGSAHSWDNINWTKEGVNSFAGYSGDVASPCVIKFGTSDYRMWLSLVSGNNTSIAYATSLDGLAWTVVNVVLAGSTWDSLGTALPWVIYEDGKYKMWYTGRFDDGSTVGEMRIGYASSDFPEGPFTKQATAILTRNTDPLAWDGKWVGACSVIKKGTMYVMYYTGFSSEMGGTFARIGRAYSSNGITWNRSALPVLDIGSSGSWEDKGVAAPSVLYEEGTTLMWYTGGNTELEFAIGYASEEDEISVPGSSGWSLGLTIGGFILAMGAVIWWKRDVLFRGSRA